MNRMFATDPAAVAARDAVHPVADGRRSMTFSAFCAVKRFPALDGLRALAVLAVLLYHCPAFSQPALAALQSAGDIGVDVFFVISGFLITTLILREAPDRLPRRLGRFYARRSLRIFPLYYLAIVVYGAKAWLAADHASWDTYASFIPWLLTYCADIRLGVQPQPFPVFGIAWSLGVEEKFYLLWPIVVMCLSRKLVLRIGIAVIVASCVWRAWLSMTFEGNVAARLYYAFDTRMDAIMWGCVLACVLADRRWYEPLRSALARPGVAICAMLGLVLFAAGSSNDSQLRYVVVPLLATIVLACAVMWPRMPGLPALSWRPIAYVGAVSYGVYIFHQLAIAAARRICGQETDAKVLLTVCLAAALSIGVAGASHVLYERPFLKLKKRFAP